MAVSKTTRVEGLSAAKMPSTTPLHFALAAMMAVLKLTTSHAQMAESELISVEKIANFISNSVARALAIALLVKAIATFAAFIVFMGAIVTWLLEAQRGQGVPVVIKAAQHLFHDMSCAHKTTI